MSADGEQGGVRALAIEVLADVTERLAPAGKYVARDIRNGILSSDNERAIWAMIEFARRLTVPATDTPDAVTIALCAAIVSEEGPQNPESDWTEYARSRGSMRDNILKRFTALAKHPTSPEDAA